MKNPSLLPAAFAGGLLGAILVAVPVFLYLGSAQDPGQTPGRTVGPEAPSAAPAPGEDPLLREELTMLADRVEDLSAELDMLRGDLSRRPAPGALDSEQVVLAAAAEQAQFTEEQRAAISDILARAREQEAELRASERAAREEQLVLDRAGRIAEQLALSIGDETALADHLRTEADRRREIIDRSRAEDYDRDLLRDEFVALRDWSEQNLIDTFGADLAGQIRAAERNTRGSSLDRERGGRRGGGGDGGGGRGR